MTLAAWLSRSDLPTGTPGGEAEQDAACDLATHVLFALSGRRWAGHITRTILIYAKGDPWWWHDAALGGADYGASLMGDGWGLPALPVLYGGQIYNSTGRGQRGIRLPDYPVREVSAVRVAGQEVDPTTYWLSGSRYLQHSWLSGWPTIGLGCDRVMEVDYAAGAEPPASGKTAAVLLATELSKAAAGQQSALPGYVTQRVRQATTESFVSAATLFEKGKTGLAPVDLWLSAVNPGGLRRRARSWSPDTDPLYRTTSTGGTTP